MWLEHVLPGSTPTAFPTAGPRPSTWGWSTRCSLPTGSSVSKLAYRLLGLDEAARGDEVFAQSCPCPDPRAD